MLTSTTHGHELSGLADGHVTLSTYQCHRHTLAGIPAVDDGTAYHATEKDNTTDDDDAHVVEDCI